MQDLRPAKELLDIRYKHHHTQNAIYISAGESDSHLIAKVLQCKKLLQEGKTYYTEAVWKNKSGRADIFCLDELQAYEIVVSESEESIARKRKEYPVPIEVVVPKVEYKTME